MKLYIDTSQIRVCSVRFGKFEKKSDTLLPLIMDALQENNCTLKNITEIIVHTGPGSFTGLRVGATIANMLGYLLNIPVNGKKALVIPSYT